MPASSSSKTFPSSSSVSSPTTATASSSRRPDPNRSKGGLESMKLFINLDSLITIHSRKPPAPEEKFFLTGIKNEDDMNLNWLRNLGAPKVFTIENPLSSLTNTNEQDNEQDSSSSFLYNSSKIWVRTRPFADLFAQLVPARVDCLVFSPLPRDLLDAILNQLGWNGFIRSSDVRPVVVGSSSSKESENDSTFDENSSLLRTLPQIGILPSMNGHLRGLILDSSRSLWHPLLHNQILIIPKQNAAKSLPRFVEPFGILVTMSTVFDVVNLYEASCAGISASQCLSEIQQTRFDSMKVHCPSSSSVATLLSAATSSSSSSSASTSPDIVNYEFSNDKVRMVVSNGGGLSSANKSDANLWLFSGVNKPSNLDAKSSAALVNAYTSVVPEPSCDVSVVRGSYFDACQAFQCPLPPVLFSLSKEDLYGPTKLTSTFSNTSSINDLGDTVLPSSRNEDDAALQDSADNNETKSSSRHHKSSSSSTKTTTSKVHTVNLASWWDWISSRSPLPSSNLQTVLISCSGEEIEEEVTKAIRFNQQKKELYSKMKSDRAEEALSRSADKPSISMEDLHLLSTSDWISSSSLPPSMTPKKIKEDTFFVATWLLARCLAPFSKATAWLPVKTLWQCLTHVKCEPSKSFLGKVFDSTALLSSSSDDSTSSSSKTSSVRSTSSTTKPGLTNFIVSPDGSYIARVSASSKSIHSKYQSSSNNYLNSRSGTVRPGENFSKDSSTATEGDQRARLPPPASVETQTSIDIKTRSIAVQAQLMVAAPHQQQIQQQQQIQKQQPIQTIVQQQQPHQPSFSAQRRSREETTTATTTTSTTPVDESVDIFAQQYGSDASSSSSTTDNSHQQTQTQTQQPKDFSFDDLLVPANSANSSNTKGFKQIQHLHQANKTEEDDDDIFEKPPTTSSIATRLGKDGKEAPPPPPPTPQAQPSSSAAAAPSSAPRGSSSSSSSSASLLPIPSSTTTATGANNFNFIQNNNMNHINNNNRSFVNNQNAVMPTPDELIALQTGCGIGRQNLENPSEWEPLLNHAQMNLRPQGHHKFASTIERAVNYFRQRQMRNTSSTSNGSPAGGVQRL